MDLSNIPYIGLTTYEVLNSQICNSDYYLSLAEETKWKDILKRVRGLFLVGDKNEGFGWQYFDNHSFCFPDEGGGIEEEVFSDLSARLGGNRDKKMLTRLIYKYYHIKQKGIDLAKIEEFYVQERLYYIRCLNSLFRKLFLKPPLEKGDRKTYVWLDTIDFFHKQGIWGCVKLLLDGSLAVKTDVMRGVGDMDVMERRHVLQERKLEEVSEILDLCIVIARAIKQRHGKGEFRKFGKNPRVSNIIHIVKSLTVTHFGYKLYRVKMHSRGFRRLMRHVALGLVAFITLLEFDSYVFEPHGQHPQEMDLYGHYIDEMYGEVTVLMKILEKLKGKRKAHIGAVFLIWGVYLKYRVEKTFKRRSASTAYHRLGLREKIPFFFKEGLKLGGMNYLRSLFDRRDSRTFPFAHREHNFELYLDAGRSFLQALLNVVDMANVQYELFSNAMQLFITLLLPRSPYLEPDYHFTPFNEVFFNTNLIVEDATDAKDQNTFVIMMLLARLLLPARIDNLTLFAHIFYDAPSCEYVLNFINKKIAITVPVMRSVIFQSVKTNPEDGRYVLTKSFQTKLGVSMGPLLPRGTKVRILYENDKSPGENVLDYTGVALAEGGSVKEAEKEFILCSFFCKVSGLDLIISEFVNFDSKVVATAALGASAMDRLTHILTFVENCTIHGDMGILNMLDERIEKAARGKKLDIEKDNYYPGCKVIEVISRILEISVDAKNLDVMTQCMRVVQSVGRKRKLPIILRLEDFLCRFISARTFHRMIEIVTEMKKGHGMILCVLDIIHNIFQTTNRSKNLVEFAKICAECIFDKFMTWKYEKQIEKWLLALRCLQILCNCYEITLIVREDRTEIEDLMNIFYENNSMTVKVLIELLARCALFQKYIVAQERSDDIEIFAMMTEKGIELMVKILQYRNYYCRFAKEMQFEKHLTTINHVKGRQISFIRVLFKFTKVMFPPKSRRMALQCLEEIAYFPRPPNITHALGTRTVKCAARLVRIFRKEIERDVLKTGIMRFLSGCLYSQRPFFHMCMNYNPLCEYEENEVFELHKGISEIHRTGMLDVMLKILRANKAPQVLIYYIVLILSEVYESAHFRDIVVVTRPKTDFWSSIFDLLRYFERRCRVNGVTSPWDLKIVAKIYKLITVDLYYSKVFLKDEVQMDRYSALYQVMKDVHNDSLLFYEVIEVAIDAYKSEIEDSNPIFVVQLDEIKRHKFPTHKYVNFLVNRERTRFEDDNLYFFNLCHIDRWSPETTKLSDLCLRLNRKMWVFDCFLELMAMIEPLLVVFFIPNFDSENCDQFDTSNYRLNSLKQMQQLIDALFRGMLISKQVEKRTKIKIVDHVHTIIIRWNFVASKIMLHLLKSIAQMAKLMYFKFEGKKKLRIKPVFLKKHLKMLCMVLSNHMERNWHSESMVSVILTSFIFVSAHLEQLFHSIFVYEFSADLIPMLKVIIKKYGPSTHAACLALHLLSLLQHKDSSVVEFVCDLLVNFPGSLTGTATLKDFSDPKFSVDPEAGIVKPFKNVRVVDHPEYIISALNVLFSLPKESMNYVFKKNIIKVARKMMLKFTGGVEPINIEVYRSDGEQEHWHKIWIYILRLVLLLIDFNIVEEFIDVNQGRIVHLLTQMWNRKELHYVEVEEAELLSAIFNASYEILLKKPKIVRTICVGFSSCVDVLKRKFKEFVQPMSRMEKIISRFEDDDDMRILDRSFFLLEKTAFSWDAKIYISVFQMLRCFLATICALSEISFQKGIKIVLLGVRRRMGINRNDPNIFDVIELIKYSSELLSLVTIQDPKSRRFNEREAKKLNELIQDVIRRAGETCRVYFSKVSSKNMEVNREIANMVEELTKRNIALPKAFQ